jgi:putative selenate reductase
MSDIMRPQPFDVLLRWILRELEHNGSIFGIPHALFYRPRPHAPYASEIFGHALATRNWPRISCAPGCREGDSLN